MVEEIIFFFLIWLYFFYSRRKLGCNGEMSQPKLHKHEATKNEGLKFPKERYNLNIVQEENCPRTVFFAQLNN
jgi:hypothetical protein